MKYILLLSILALNFSGFSQEIGSIKDGEHIIKIHKTNNQFSCFYSDASLSVSTDLKSFQFPNIEQVYNIIMDGFENENNHKTYVLTNKDTIVKFEFNRINGEVQLKIKHNNLLNNTIGSTSALSKTQIHELFGSSIPN
ncbi:hypothetical protein [Urechidicola vernalis]|uniref:DUF4251 domain-containing protein n=1 Tax=Urechidicola vernalis TaxID=3075600 RepID=A0ABU2Y5H2_9FLAO|nr:hypothetical protein [Urechidicola sp. P050]MDT0553426.1 hypothetical protein [Urechidicola sp. P050]